MDTFRRRFQHTFFFVLLSGAIIIMYFLLRPFLAALILALSLAIVFKPVYAYLHKITKHETVAALYTVSLVIIIVLIPLGLIISLMFNEAYSLYASLQIPTSATHIGQNITGILQRFHLPQDSVSLNISSYLQSILTWLLEHLNVFFTEFLHVFFSTIIMIMALFYFLRDGEYLRKKYVDLSPLSKKYDEEIIHKVSGAVTSVVRGSIIVSVVHGVLATIGTLIVGFSNPVLLGVATGLANLVPGVGTTLVIVPAIFYLMATGDFIGALFLGLWQIGVIIFVDNFLTPWILNQRMKIHQFFILLSILGGIAFFGPIGFLLGPILVAFFFALIDIYPLLFKT